MRYRVETRGAAVAVARGRFAEVDSAASDLTVSLPDGLLLPGLINAHDHLHRNHYPRLGRPPYADAYAWGRDIHARDAATIRSARAVPRRTALLFGAFKNLISGVTTVVHHDRCEPDFHDDFPVHIARLRTAHSLRFDAAAVNELRALPSPDREVPDPPASCEPFAIHLAEGVTEAAAAELDELERLGLLRRGLLAVHAVALDRRGAQRLHRAGAAIVWCPSSNLFLLGRTCSRAVLDASDVLIGTDSLLTADGTLLDELRVARRLSFLSDDRLEQAVGAHAAQRLGVTAGLIAPGRPADLVLLRVPLLDARVADVALVTVDGLPRIADPEFGELFELAGIPAVPMDIGGVRKLVQSSLAEAAAAVMDDWPDAARILAPHSPSAAPPRPSDAHV